MGNDVCMWEMAYVFEKRLKFLGYVGDLCEMAKICGEMAKLFDKRLKNVEYDLEIWEMAKIYRKRFRYMVHGLSI